MRTLVVFYSRTGMTKKVGEAIAKQLSCEIEEIFDTKKRDGFLGYLVSGWDAAREKLTVLKEIKKDPKEYDLVIIGTPVWFFNIAPPIRTYIVHNQDRLKNVAFFVTCGGSGGKGVLEKMARLYGKKPNAILALREKEIKTGEFLPKVENFVAGLKRLKIIF